ncbi:MAG TPA: four helix bundle protein [Thermoanaerobaculia bacterium]|nr:four helix bundle protein [Thermoanaerobaculia bacterium]
MNLVDRTRDFALRVIRLCSALPSNRTADVIARQLLRSGTSPGAHFREALRARSKSEYVSKLNGGLMELEETLYWLEIVEAAGLMTSKKLGPLKTETTELIAIFVSLIKKWKGR